jgi:hypothetical protein
MKTASIFLKKIKFLVLRVIYPCVLNALLHINLYIQSLAILMVHYARL